MNQSDAPPVREKTHYPLNEGKPRVVVLGCGFGGLSFCLKFKGDAEVVLVDKHNHHLFQPLLYQVAMAGLSVPEVAEPIRSIFRNRRNVMTVMETVESIDLQRRRVELRQSSIDYTWLVLGLGGKVSYFGNDHWAQHAPGLKSVNDALRIRTKVLTSFERAETEIDPKERRRLMTIVVVGGGPTGVELAGTMAELARKTFKRDFRKINTSNTRIILIDGGDRLLGTYPPSLSESAKRQLEELGVQVMLETRVQDVDAQAVTLDTGERIETRNVLWGGGITANPVTQTLGIDLGPGGRIPVNDDQSIPGHPEAFAVGDIITLQMPDGGYAPGVAQNAIQGGAHVAELIDDEIKRGEARPPEQRPPYRYKDRGSMATIGRNKAVAWVGKFKFSGFFAWLLWAVVHLFFLIGFRNKAVTLVQWMYSYALYRPGARIVFSPIDRDGYADPDSAQASEETNHHEAEQPSPEPETEPAGKA